jgi:hypothetical protein
LRDRTTEKANSAGPFTQGYKGKADHNKTVCQNIVAKAAAGAASKQAGTTHAAAMSISCALG